MTITIEAKPLEVKAELPGYGLFYLRHLGAGAEADLRERLQKAQKIVDEIKEKYADIIEEENKLIETGDKKALAEFRATEHYKKAQEEQAGSAKTLQEVADYVNATQLKLWRSDDPKAMEGLLNDFTTAEIIGFYKQVMEEADNA